MPELLPYEPGSPDWLAARRAGVTATDIVTILGLSSWDSQYSLLWRKLGQVPEVPDSDRFRLGRELEPYVMARWGEVNPDACYDLLGPRLWRSAVRPWQMATPDSVLYDGEAKAVTGREVEPSATIGVLECKTWADADRGSWGAECGNQGQPCDHVPAQVRAQVLWQMDVMDVPAGHVGVVFLPSGEFRSYVIEHEPCNHDDACVFGGQGTCERCEVCADLDLMRTEGEMFMRRLRLELPPPDPDSSAATLAAVRARFIPQPAKQAEVDPDLWQRYLNAKHDRDVFENMTRQREILLREQAGEASVLTVNGVPVARRVISDAQVRAHVRHQDYLKRIKQEVNSDETC